MPHEITMVIVNNGDPGDPEIWGFDSESQADEFALARSNRAYVQSLAVLDESEGADAIKSWKRGM